MNKEVCKRFKNVWEDFPDTLNNGDYQFNIDRHFKTYCTNNNCEMPLEKINAACLYLFDGFFKDADLFKSVAKSNIDIVEYIMIWLSYMVNLKNNEPNLTNQQHFYTAYIKSGNKYNNTINHVSGYNSYKKLIDKNNYFLSMDKSIIFKFYDAFKSLCNLYNELDDNQNCKKYLDDDNDFFKKYEELKKDSSITGNNSYIKILYTLSDDYDNLKNKCNNSPSLLTNSLISIAFIFGAIALFLGISYKYSLFGFRKRFQKQKLREKIKNIKKKMNH
ncbi:uncharacterized protein PY17X_1400900 [Plasmodium yoelii]|uniref:PIR protein n=3 Tax=Plasmodium yoelii TaxID=5861 RepID=A0AAE9X299_PLAYO|nr:uncharacterized protein PY17X_1400900 [Plasmodium yoelii]EAA20034.1 putative yir3 protein [Plasmodium yoelii yoelii]WBY60548.1 PIR protein [Plasmodium yoelii yoelii]CDU20364.1 YIR protein [Plasmodium yoelii]VTZ81324.1 PIR protein [Plasmodium yoelii]|eukprot:XP_728469.1 uncharacterized protein PY17X_1400900 [Plasmodium yoelii]